MHPLTSSSRRPAFGRRALTLTSVAAATLLSAAACTSAPALTEATVIDTPSIVWENEIEPSSPLEASPYVQYLRALELGKALSWNTGDFTIEQLASTHPLPSDW